MNVKMLMVVSCAGTVQLDMCGPVQGQMTTATLVSPPIGSLVMVGHGMIIVQMKQGVLMGTTVVFDAQRMVGV
jgi:hypothetical protein